jgi:hypothetical protein
MKITLDVDDALYARAREFVDSGTNDSDLLCEALQEFVRLRAARRLAASGGAMPDMPEIPRRRVDRE